MALKVIPLELREANTIVSWWHRHHKPCQGHRFSIGAYDTTLQRVVGCAIVGRPVARKTDHRTTLEIVRLATDGSPNACSFLLGAVCRIGSELGYCRVQTFTLPEEGGASLRAASFKCEGEAGGGQWKHTDGKQRRTDQPNGPKVKWAKDIRPVFWSPVGIATQFQPDLHVTTLVEV